jgi:cytochrome c oxidase cbb3-type subunit 2
MSFVRLVLFFLGVLAALLLGWWAIVGLPESMLAKVAAPSGLKPYTQEQAAGRETYIREGCVYCHSQQPRPEGFGADQSRFWGRPSIAADYVYDTPHLLGTMRSGPDLFNVSVRRPDSVWHYEHLHDPRHLVPGSIMPRFPWLFDEGTSAPAPEGRVLVAYLLSLDHTYPITPHDTVESSP